MTNDEMRHVGAGVVGHSGLGVDSGFWFRHSGLLQWVLKRERALFFLTITVLLAPVWAFTYLPTTDGPAHLANADIMRRMGDESVSVFRKYYVLSRTPSPNLVGHLVLVGLLGVVKPVVAEKILVSLYVVLFPIGVRYLAGGIRRRGGVMAWMALPMVYSYLMGQGFYNFCLSLGAFCFVVGYWVRHRERMHVWRGGVLFFPGGVLYACHLFSLMMACGVIGGMVGWLAWIRKGSGGKSVGSGQWAVGSGEGSGVRVQGSGKTGGMGSVVVVAVALLPWVVMGVLFRPSTAGFAGHGGSSWDIKEDLVSFLSFSTMVSYRAQEAWIGGAIATLILGTAGFVLAGKIARGRWCKWDGLLVVPVGLFAFYLKAHDATSIHFYIPQRVMFYFYLMVVVWIAGQAMTRRMRGVLPPVGMVLALLMTASHGMKYREFSKQLAEFVRAGDVIEKNSTFLPLVFSPQGLNEFGKASSIDVAPFYMASGYIAVERVAVDLRNYEAKTDHFPVRFVEGVNPYLKLGVSSGVNEGLDALPPQLDFAKFRAAGGEVDYVMVWGMTDGLRGHADTVKLYEQLEAGYERVEVGGKRIEVWKRKAATNLH